MLWQGSPTNRRASVTFTFRVRDGPPRRDWSDTASLRRERDPLLPPRGADYAGTDTGAGKPFVIALIRSSTSKRSIRMSVNAGFEATFGANISAR